VIFTTKAGEARTMVEALSDALKKQEQGTTETTGQKETEETELEDEAMALGDAVVQFYKDKGQLNEAEALVLTESAWRGLRDQQLLAKSQLVLDKLTALTSGPLAAEAVPYGITPAALASLTDERQDYAEIVNAPAVAIAIRKALTKGARPAFRLVDEKFAELDRLIRQFRKTAAGKALIAAWEVARVIKGPGQGTTKPATTTVPTPAPRP
jgi:hypothetical protein